MPGIVPTGMLRLAIVLQNPTTTTDSFGQGSVTFADGPTLWAHVDAARSTEVMYDQGVATRSDYKFLTSYYPGVTTAHRLKWVDVGGTRYFNIKGVWDRDQRQRRLEIEAVEVVL